MTHPITKHPDGCACSRCDLIYRGEPFPLDEIGYYQNTDRLTLEQRFASFKAVVEGAAEQFGVVLTDVEHGPRGRLRLYVFDFKGTFKP
jgi:hypothetical protein